MKAFSNYWQKSFLALSRASNISSSFAYGSGAATIPLVPPVASAPDLIAL